MNTVGRTRNRWRGALLEVPPHRLLAHRHPVLDAAGLDLRVDRRRYGLDPEEPVDDAEDRLELLAALEPDHEVGLQHVDLVVLHELTADPARPPRRCPRSAAPRPRSALGRGGDRAPQPTGRGDPAARSSRRTRARRPRTSARGSGRPAHGCASSRPSPVDRPSSGPRRRRCRRPVCRSAARTRRWHARACSCRRRARRGTGPSGHAAPPDRRAARARSSWVLRAIAEVPAVG